MVNDGIVGDFGKLGISGGGSAEEEGSEENVIQLDGVVLLDDLGVDIRNEEEGRHEEQTETGTERDSDNVPGGFVGETELRGSFVDDRQSTDGTSDQEEERRGPHGPRNGIGAEVDNELDQHEDGCTKTGCNERSHCQSGKDGTKTLSAVPAPLNTLGTDSRNTDTCN